MIHIQCFLLIRNARKHFEKLERDAQGSRSMQVTEKG